MSEFKKVYKVPDGKLLKVFAKIEDGKFSKLAITGDFFLHPEESVEELELQLLGHAPNAPEIEKSVRDFFASPKTQAFGITPDAILKVLLEIGDELNNQPTSKEAVQ